MKAVIYCRVSTKEQTENFSLRTQERACRQYCTQNSLEIDRVFVEEGESAKTANRPEFQKLLTYCQKSKGLVSHLVVYSVNRFARDKFDHHTVRVALAKWGVTLRSVTEPIDDSSTGKLMEGVLASFAQFDNDVRSERTVEGMKAALRNGRWTHQPPLGYLRSPAKTGPSLIPDADRADHIREAFKLAATGSFSKVEIAGKLSTLGFRTLKGRPLTAQTLGKILMNPIYAGWVSVPAWDVRERGNFDALVSEDLFRAVNPDGRGLSTAPTTCKTDNPDFPLRRFITCSKCGKSLSGSWPKGRRKRYAYYHCPRCRGMNFRKEDLEAKFVDLLSSLRPHPRAMRLFSEVVLDAWKARVSSQEALRALLRGRQGVVEGKKSKLVEAYLYDRKIDRETYEDQSAKLAEELSAVKRELAAVSNAPEMDIEGILGFGGQLLTKCDQLWPLMPYRHQQVFQKALFPAGLRFDGQKFGTAETSLIFSTLGALAPERVGVASPGGFEPPLPP